MTMGSKSIFASASPTPLPAGQPAPTSKAEVRHLDQVQLARRWGISERTLERWRWKRCGVKYLKLGGHIAYRLIDIEEYERTHLRLNVVSAEARLEA
jgi:hypothetical protein